MRNKMMIFVVLVCFTFLLLEVPKQYYTIQDQKQLLEKGVEKYEKTQTSIMNDFSLKIDSFFNYVSGKPTSGIGYTKVLTSDEVPTVLENLKEEINLLIDENNKRLFARINSSSISGRCFTAQVFDRKEETQYIWEVGFMELFIPDHDYPFARIMFDSASYKILLFAWELPKDEMEDVTDSYVYSWDSAMIYYGNFSKEIYIEDYRNAGIVYPVPIPYEFVEESSLVNDLYELAAYFWYNDYFDQKIQE